MLHFLRNWTCGTGWPGHVPSLRSVERLLNRLVVRRMVAFMFAVSVVAAACSCEQGRHKAEGNQPSEEDVATPLPLVWPVGIEGMDLPSEAELMRAEEACDSNQFVLEILGEEIEFVRVAPRSLQLSGPGGRAIGRALEQVLITDLGSDEVEMVQVELTYAFYMTPELIDSALYAEYLNRVGETEGSDQLGTYAGSSVQYDAAQGEFVAMSEAPANSVPLSGVVGFCKWVREHSGLPIRIPTESEWIIAEAMLNPEGEHDSITGAWTGDYYSGKALRGTMIDSIGIPASESMVDGLGGTARVVRRQLPPHNSRIGGPEGNVRAGLYGVKLVFACGMHERAMD